MKLCENMKNGNLFNRWKFQTSISESSRENHVSPRTFQTDINKDILNYRVASILKTKTITTEYIFIKKIDLKHNKLKI